MRHAGVMPSLPTPFRAALGLVATALDEARNLPDKAIELPMLALSTALQLSLRAQQHYARLTARGDEVLSQRAVGDDAPPWATFDEPAAAPTVVTSADGTSADGTPARAPAKANPKPKAKANAPRKTVRAPRTGKPSAFDAIGDE
jgi:hypothetical protein